MRPVCDQIASYIPVLSAVTDLYGRTFAIWTLVTCSLCVICSQDPTNRAIYGAPQLTAACWCIGAGS